MEQIDLILLILIGLSVLVGRVRGLSDEILRLIIYILSGVLGYALAPLVQPVFSMVPGNALQRGMAIFSGTVVSWFVLKIAASSLIKKIKESRFRSLDGSLGTVFGGARAGIFLLLLNLIFGLLAPHLVQSSGILTIAGKGTAFLIHSFPEFEIFDPKKTETADAQDMNWKKRLLYYLQNTTVGEEEEKSSLLSYVSSKMAKEMSQKMLEQGLIKFEEKKDVVLLAENEQETDPEKQMMEISPEMLEENVAQTFEMRITAWLKDEPLDQDEIQKKMAEKLKERILQSEDSGD